MTRVANKTHFQAEEAVNHVAAISVVEKLDFVVVFVVLLGSLITGFSVRRLLTTRPKS